MDPSKGFGENDLAIEGLVGCAALQMRVQAVEVHVCCLGRDKLAGDPTVATAVVVGAS